MAKDDIRALLASVQPSAFLDRTPGTVSILRSRVEEAGGDPTAVAAWVEAHGGRVDKKLPYRRQGKGSRYGFKVSEAEQFYVVPAEALGE